MTASYTEREAALAAHEANEKDFHATEARRLKLAYQANDDRLAHNLEVARREHEATHDALDAALADEVRACFWPTIAKLGEGRQAVPAIVTCFQAFDARCRDELGCELDGRVLVLALAAAHGVLDATGNPEFWSHAAHNDALERSDLALRAIRTSQPAISVEDYLRAAEVAIVKRTANYAGDSDRALIHAARATDAGISQALRTFDQQRVDAERERAAAAFREHTSLWAKVQNAIRRGQPSQKHFDDLERFNREREALGM